MELDARIGGDDQRLYVAGVARLYTAAMEFDVLLGHGTSSLVRDVPDSYGVTVAAPPPRARSKSRRKSGTQFRPRTAQSEILIGMGESNLETLRKAALPTQGIDFAAFMRAYSAADQNNATPEQTETLARMLDLFDPDVEIDASAMDLPGFGVYRGPEAMVEFWLHWLEEWEDYSWTFTGWSEQGDHVIVETQSRGTGRSSGALVVWDHCTIYTFRDGKVIRWTLFRDRASAMAAIDSLASKR